MAAAEVLEWDRITDFLNEIVFYIPNVLIAVVILVLGVIAGKFLDEVVVRSIKGSNTPVNNPEVIGAITRYALITFAVLAALIQLGIAPSLIEILFAGIVLAAALAFGLGGREKAAKLLDYIDGSK
jgi:small-conductance mechanosensitive channel